MRVIRRVAAGSLALLLGMPAFGMPGVTERRETLTGRLVAFTNVAPCNTGYVSWVGIVYMPGHKDQRVAYAALQFSYPCERVPDWLTGPVTERRFRVTREKACDHVLEKDVPVESKSGEVRLVPIWRMVAGAENEELPYGQFVPCYWSLDYPVRSGV